MNCTGLSIITWWAFKKIVGCGSTYPSFGVEEEEEICLFNIVLISMSLYKFSNVNYI